MSQMSTSNVQRDVNDNVNIVKAGSTILTCNRLVLVAARIREAPGTRQDFGSQVPSP